MTRTPFVFVLMPFAEPFRAVYDRAIKAACDQVGVRCERVDEQIFAENILLRIYEQIEAADIIVADVTDRNPNVLYEIGYAHALQKRVILLTQHSHDSPFDLQHYPHVIYRDGAFDELRDQLVRRVQALLANPPRATGRRDTFPWPHLLRRATAILDAAIQRVQELLAVSKPETLVDEMADFADRFGAFRSPDVQITVVDADRKLLFHDYASLIGRRALHVGLDGHNIYDDILNYDQGAVAWTDQKSNLGGTPPVRDNVALFAAVPGTRLKVVVEAHHEIGEPR